MIHVFLHAKLVKTQFIVTLVLTIGSYMAPHVYKNVMNLQDYSTTETLGLVTFVTHLVKLASNQKTDLMNVNLVRSMKIVMVKCSAAQEQNYVYMMVLIVIPQQMKFGFPVLQIV